MNQAFSGIEIIAISGCVPNNIIRNDKFENLLTPKEIKFFEKTVGILERRWADKDITASDLAFEACLNLFDNYKFDINEIDSLIFLSQTPDFKIPFTSNILQERLGLKREILCLDINAGCAGFIQGLSTSFSIAKSLAKGRKVLFVVAETLSKILSEKDRSTSMLFGDGACAILIENSENLDAKAFFNFFSDGKNADAIQIPDGGYRNEVKLESFSSFLDEKGNEKNYLQLEMDGPKVFDFTLREIAPSIKKILDYSNFKDEDINYYLLHQSNQFIIKQIASQLNVDQDKMLINIEKYGNISGVSIPLLMTSNKHKLQQETNLLLSGFVLGLNWGNCILEKINLRYINLLNDAE